MLPNIEDIHQTDMPGMTERGTHARAGVSENISKRPLYLGRTGLAALFAITLATAPAVTHAFTQSVGTAISNIFPMGHNG